MLVSSKPNTKNHNIQIYMLQVIYQSHISLLKHVSLDTDISSKNFTVVFSMVVQIQDSVTAKIRCRVGQYLVDRKFSEDKYPDYGKLMREELGDV